MRVTDFAIEQALSRLLRTGVVLAGSTVLAGGALYLARHGGETVNFKHFEGQSAMDRLIPQILTDALHGRARSLIQLGVLLLIATPVARVAFSVFGFLAEGDKRFGLISGIVLAILSFSLIYGVAAH